MIHVLTKIYSKTWKTCVWPALWTQSLIFILPKEGDLQLCQNYRTISLNSHPSKVMLKVILNRLHSQADEVFASSMAHRRTEIWI